MIRHIETSQNRNLDNNMNLKLNELKVNFESELANIKSTLNPKNYQQSSVIEKLTSTNNLLSDEVKFLRQLLVNNMKPPPTTTKSYADATKITPYREIFDSGCNSNSNPSYEFISPKKFVKQPENKKMAPIIPTSNRYEGLPIEPTQNQQEREPIIKKTYTNDI